MRSMKQSEHRAIEIVAAMGAWLEDKERDVQTLEDEAADQAAELNRLNGLLDEKAVDLSREQGENYRLRGEVSDLRIEVSRLKEQLVSVNKITFISSLQPQKPLYCWIIGEGRSMWFRGEKLNCIKKVRELTGCALKEAKDFVESFQWGTALEDETMPDTIPRYAAMRYCLDHTPIQNKINAIKDVRQITTWGLKEAKDFVEYYIASLDTGNVCPRNWSDQPISVDAIRASLKLEAEVTGCEMRYHAAVNHPTQKWPE